MSFKVADIANFEAVVKTASKYFLGLGRSFRYKKNAQVNDHLIYSSLETKNIADFCSGRILK